MAVPITRYPVSYDYSSSYFESLSVHLSFPAFRFHCLYSTVYLWLIEAGMLSGHGDILSPCFFLLLLLVKDEPLPKRACLSLEDTANLAPPQSQVSVTANDSECSSTDIINGQPVDNDNGAGNGPSRSDEGRKELKELSRKVN